MKHHTTPAITIALLLCLSVSAAQKKTAHTVDLLDLDPSTALNGNVAVRVRISVDPGKPVRTPLWSPFQWTELRRFKH